MKFVIERFTTYLLLAATVTIFSSQTKMPAGTIKITFKNSVNGLPLILHDSTYTNPFGESYTVKKFRYYISNVKLNTARTPVKELHSYHLIDAAKENSLSFSFPAKVQNYVSVTFLLGVDSIRNVSGAQTGALDPINDMFWTWNTGYVMAKLEGNSPSSTLYNNMFEYHVGGFSGVNNVLKTITLELPASKLLQVKPGKTSEVVINADVNAWWKNVNDIKIKEQAGITSPGPLAKKISDNYAAMFSIVSVN